MTGKPKPHGAPALRGAHLPAGLLVVALGFVGAFLQVLPTTPFPDPGTPKNQNAGWKLSDGWWTRPIRPGDNLAAIAAHGEPAVVAPTPEPLQAASRSTATH